MPASAKTTPKTKRIRWIAERRLERRDAVGGIVVVRIGSPEWPPGAEEWRCPYVIEGLGDDSIRFGHSNETMAALLNAIQGIHYDLERTGIPLRWEGAREDVTGFSQYVTWTYGRAFQQRLETMLLEEETEHVRRQQEERRARRQKKKRP
jgi:hypothetical protein